jgi:hypothetical protein
MFDQEFLGVLRATWREHIFLPKGAEAEPDHEGAG